MTVRGTPGMRKKNGIAKKRPPGGHVQMPSRMRATPATRSIHPSHVRTRFTQPIGSIGIRKHSQCLIITG